MDTNHVQWLQAITCYLYHQHWRYTIIKLPRNGKKKLNELGVTMYSLATELNNKSEAIQVATLLTVIGKEAREVFVHVVWTSAENSAKIKEVLTKFEEYCQLHKNVPFERYRFNRRVQETGGTYDQYCTALIKVDEGCEFQTNTPDAILRDILVFGIRDNKVRERLL